MNDISVIQQELKTQMQENNKKVDKCAAEQQFIAQQVRANGQAVAQLTLQQFDKEPQEFTEGSVSAIFEDEEEFQNVFAHTKDTHKPSTSKQPRHTQHHTKKEDLPHHTLPKMQFPTFDGENPKIWIDNCENYFTIYTIPERLWVTTASMHLQGNAAMWWQAYKQTHRKISWKDFCSTVQSKFGSDDYKSAVQEMLNLKQTETVEEYTT